MRHIFLEERVAILEAKLAAISAQLGLAHAANTTVGAHQEIALIKAVVTSYFGLAQSAMTTSKKESGIAWPRMVAMAIARKLVQASLAEIGQQFGGRDHGTVMHAGTRVKDRCGNDAKFREIYRAILAQCEHVITHNSNEKKETLAERETTPGCDRSEHADGESVAP